MDLPFHSADLRPRLAEVRLRMARLVPKRHEYVAPPLATVVNVVLHDRHRAAIAIAELKLIDPERRTVERRIKKPGSRA